MHIVIKYKYDLPENWRCMCNKTNPSYMVKVEDYPEHLEPPMGIFTCCNDCVTQALDYFEPIMRDQNEFEKKYSKTVGCLNIKREQMLRELASKESRE